MTTTTQKPDEFVASGGSPPQAQVPPHLVEELADILAEALVADVQSPDLTALRAVSEPTTKSPRGTASKTKATVAVTRSPSSGALDSAATP